LKTTQYVPSYLANYLTVSVLPVPAGPAGEPPKNYYNAYANVIKQRSVNGVITNESEVPIYSY